jgi:hypothetical protein
MPAKVTITRSFGSLDDLQLVTADDMREIGLLAREQILRRTLSGVDVNGQPFQPYSKGYAEAKQKALGTSAVNLQVSGGMLNDITVSDAQADGEKASVTLGWTK